LAQSCVSQIITNPLTNAAFTNISPRFQLNGSRIIPTFIVHGTKDRVVPYAYSTDGMSTALTNFGGLIGTYSNTSGPAIPASNLYSTYTSKHIIKLFTNADHDVANNVQTQPDILTWINGHK
jgi:predicted esterase